MLVFINAPFLVLHFSYFINDLPDDVICNIAIYGHDTTLTLNVIRHLFYGKN